MQNTHLWQPTKFVKTSDGYGPSKDLEQVGYSSRFLVSIVAPVYERVIKEHSKGRLLDVGCGNVPLYDIYRDCVTESVCIDWENSLHPNKFIDKYVDLNQPIPLEQESFDTILATDVFEHIFEHRQLFVEIARLLKPQGKAIISTPFFYWLHEEPHDYYRYTRYAFEKFCAENNLNITSLLPYGGAPEVVCDITVKAVLGALENSPTLTRMFSSVHFTLARFLTSLSLMRRLSRATVESFPLGYCLVAQKGGEGLRVVSSVT